LNPLIPKKFRSTEIFGPVSYYRHFFAFHYRQKGRPQISFNKMVHGKMGGPAASHGVSA
jgi:hypothetical protein